MSASPSRRLLLKAGAAGAATVGVSALGLSGCAALAPPSEPDMTAMTSTEAIAAIRSGRMSAERYVIAALDRAERLRDLNALIAIDRAGAIAQARRVDAMRASGAALAPLAGLAIVVKDNINTRDLPTTGGTLALRNVRPGANAPALQKLVDAGAIVIAKANLHELSFGITSTNLSPFAGPVKNPYDRTRIPGGSSGGTAVAIATRVVASGLGTDTGGSTRIPAALCGIVGLRPSVGNGGAERRYDGAGVVPISHTRDTVGPMGRTVADVALLDAVIAGATPIAPAPLAGIRIGIAASFWAGLQGDVSVVAGAARTRLAAAGVRFVEVDTVGLAALNEKVSFPVALHEPIADIPAYLAATGVSGIGVAEIAAQIASPDVKGRVRCDPGGRARRRLRRCGQCLAAAHAGALRRLLPRQPSRSDDVPDHDRGRRAHRHHCGLGEVPARRQSRRHLPDLHPQHRSGQQCRHPGPRAAGRDDSIGSSRRHRARWPARQRSSPSRHRAGVRGGARQAAGAARLTTRAEG
jgi:mandelamide amidase